VSGGRLAGKRTLITGAGSGLGRGAALRFAAEGAAVACADRDGAAAAETARMIEDKGGRAIACAADVTSDADTEQMVAETVAAFGGLDALYANAGVAGPGSAPDLDLEDWNRVIAVNLTGVYLSARHALRRMLAQGSGGSIVTQASVGGLIGIPGLASYAASKAGVVGLTRQLAVEYAPMGIRVNAICPGTVPTPLVVGTYTEQRGALADDWQEVRAQDYPLRRLGTPDDVAHAAVFLVSDESSWITGQIWAVDGGMTAA
jgi:Dehydrogenases with different specificities (related to short-chain alcohol dehydrogenases)